jgi:hypothetical protein
LVDYLLGCLPDCLSACLIVCLPACLFTCLLIWLSLYLSAYLVVCLLVWLSACLSGYLPGYLVVWLVVWLSGCRLVSYLAGWLVSILFFLSRAVINLYRRFWCCSLYWISSNPPPIILPEHAKPAWLRVILALLPAWLVVPCNC